MSKKEKSIHIIEFLGKKTDRESWSKKFLSHGKQDGYKKLLVSSGSMSGMEKIPIHDEYKIIMERNTNLDVKNHKLGESNKLNNED